MEIFDDVAARTSEYEGLVASRATYSNEAYLRDVARVEEDMAAAYPAGTPDDPTVFFVRSTPTLRRSGDGYELSHADDRLLVAAGEAALIVWLGDEQAGNYAFIGMDNAQATEAFNRLG